MTKREKKRRSRRTRGLRYVTPYRVRRRFPRLEEHEHLDRELRDIDLLTKLKLEYPPQIEDGPFEWNFLEQSLSELISYKTGVLREKSERHGLSSEGSRSELLERLYFHYRASFSRRYSNGNDDAFPLYGPGYEMSTDPECICGKLWLSERARKRKEWKNMKRFPRKPIIQRFPRMIRFLRRIRFPRLPSIKSNKVPDLVRDPSRLRKLLS